MDLNQWLARYQSTMQDAILALESGDLGEARHLGRVAAGYFERAVNYQEARQLEARTRREKKRKEEEEAKEKKVSAPTKMKALKKEE